MSENKHVAFDADLCVANPEAASDRIAELEDELAKARELIRKALTAAPDIDAEADTTHQLPVAYQQFKDGKWVECSPFVAFGFGTEIDKDCRPLYAAPASAAEPFGWCPIGTAPKDGSEIVAGRANTSQRCVASWREWRRGDGPIRDDHHRWRDQNGFHIEPTHWMPLPPLTIDT